MSALFELARSAGHAARRLAHPLRETLARTPDPFYLLASAPLAAPYDAHLRELQQHGIARLSGEIAPQTLATLQRDFERNFIAPLDAGQGNSATTYQGDITITEGYIDPATDAYGSNEPFAISRALLEVCLKPALVALINAYLGKRAHITQGVALRIRPHAETGFGSFQWHHDAWGKRINMMIVLTEVAEGDQHMTYVKGSHALRHAYRKYLNSRYSAEELAQHCPQGEVFSCLAKPGDIYIFDSNGLHSGNRSMGRTRDTFILHYTRMRQAIWAHRVPHEFLAGFSAEELKPLDWMLAQDRSRRPLAPPNNSWVTGLLRPDQWSW
jgi:hypothetical protein